MNKSKEPNLIEAVLHDVMHSVWTITQSLRRYQVQ